MDATPVHTRRALLACGAGLALPHARAQAFPNRPIQLVVAAPAGGPSDGLARMLAEEMSRRLGQPVVVDNRPGAGGGVAAEFVARAVPDGHTLMLSWIGNATSRALMPRLHYDINRDFAHITQVVEGSNVLVAPPVAGFRTLADFIARAKAQPGKLSYASSGNGSSGHLAMEMLKQRAGIAVLHIPYRGGAPAMNDLLGGQVQAMFVNQDAVIAHARSGRLVALATTSTTRNRLLPEVPTVAESGFPGFEATAWAGLSAPRDTPAAVLARLQAVAVEAAQGPLRPRQEAIGAQVVGSSAAQYTLFVRKETEKWAQVIQAAGIKAD